MGAISAASDERLWEIGKLVGEGKKPFVSKSKGKLPFVRSKLCDAVACIVF